MTKLQKLPPAWHAEAFDLLKANFEKIHSNFLNSTKKAVWLGIYLNYIKQRGKEDGSIPHGAFGPTLKKNIPEIVWHEANVYMRLARDVCEKGKFQIGDFHQFAHCGDLPDSLLKIIEGKTQSQLFLEFKNVDADGNPLKPGCAPGKARKLTTAEECAKAREQALENSGRLGMAVAASNKDFFLTAENSDLEINAQISVLEFGLKLRHKFIKTPKAKRGAVVAEIVSLIAQESPLKV
jgi:hypothetical protein